VEWNQGRPRTVSSDGGDTIEVIEEVSAAPQSKRTEVGSHPKEHRVATKVRALTTKARERPATMVTTRNYLTNEKAASTTNTQIKVLTDMVKSLLEAMEEQTSAVEELKREYADRIECLTRTFTQQIKTLKEQVVEMTEKIETQLSNIQPSPSTSPSYTEIARIPTSSRSSNIRALTSAGTTPPTITDTLYCTIDVSRVRDEEKSKT
jgi:hypothetical protein